MDRRIERLIDPMMVREGAGVLVKRSIATRVLDYLDPFLLLDHFESSNAEEYEAGFPLHPHRGIETVTYMLKGSVRHRDTLGNSGSIAAGDVQWMTAGRGILHEEMPVVSAEGIAGFQLWVNLPAREKMTAPRYQDISFDQIPIVRRADGAEIRVIAGTLDGIEGPIRGIAANPQYLDVALPPDSTFELEVPQGHHAFSYLFEGTILNGSQKIHALKLVVWSDGSSVKIGTGSDKARFLLVSGKPLNEPVARYGPFVMNTEEEIKQTLEQLRDGTFLSPA